MADQAKLLQSVPPISKKSATGDPARTGDMAEGRVGAEMQADAAVSMSAFQAVTYGSFILTFILAGFAAVVLFRKALDTADRRFSISAKTLAAALALMSLHGFFTTYNYTRYLNKETTTVPISLNLLFWIVLGVTIGFLTNRLIQVTGKLKVGEVVIDGLFYAGIFILITLAVSPETNTNISLILSLIALILCTVPLARFSIAYKAVKFRHPELQHKSVKRLLYSLMLFPALLPLVALFYAFKAFGPDTTLLCTNLISSGFILFVGFSLFAAIKTLKNEPTDNSAGAPATAATAAAPQVDPLVEELLAEEAIARAATAEEHKTGPSPKIEPVVAKIPAKPVQPSSVQKPTRQQANQTDKVLSKPKPPKKPDQLHKDSKKPAANSPSQIKAPAKPKKRF